MNEPSTKKTPRPSPERGRPSSPTARARRGAPGERAPGLAARAEARAAALSGVAIVYPEELPVSQRKDDIAAAIRDHQVVIVAGETGSG